MGSLTSIHASDCKALQALRLAVCLLLLLCAARVQAQSQDPWLKKGNEAMEERDFRQAMDYLLWSVNHGGGWQSKLALADCYRQQMKYALAAEWYAQVVLQPDIPPRTYFYYGQALMTTRRYADAEKWFARYAASVEGDPRAEKFANLEKLVASVKGDSLEWIVERMPINSQSSDFAPIMHNGGLLFASSRPHEIGIKHVSTIDDAPLLDIYFTRLDDQGRWSRPAPFAPLNTKLNEGPMAWGPDGYLYITRNDVDHKAHRDPQARSSLNRLRIERIKYEQSLEGKANWTEAGSMPFNDAHHAVGHPTFNPLRNVIYFASDMPGGYGGTDLYRSTLIGETWTKPTNLGPTINTAQDEMFPYMGADGQLYFASNGHLGLGGLDIFYARWMPNSEWSQVQNLGYPINSEADDFGIVFDEEGNHGYFASNRGNDPANDDIYAFLRDWPNFDCQPMIANNYCFAFIDEGFLDMDTLPFVYEWSFGDGTKQRAEEGYHCYDGPGEYHIEFNIIDTILNTVFLRQSDYTHIVRDTPQVTINVPDTVATDQQLKIDARNSVLAGCEIARYYWDLGDGTRGREPALSHAYGQAGTYEIKLGVTGLPNEDGSRLCKHCATKQVVVVTPAEMKRIEVQRLEARAARERLRDHSGPARLPEASPDLPRSTDSLQDVKFSVALEHAVTPIDQRSARFDGLKDLREVRTADGYTLFQGLEDSLTGIYPYFVQAKQLGFEDAVVVVLPDTFGTEGLKPRATKIPMERSADGMTLFLGEIKDEQGEPLRATITLEDFNHSEIIYQAETDSLGRVSIRLPNGKIYAWTAEFKDYLPASGLLDLSMASELWHGEEKLKERIVLKQLQHLAETGEAVVINNILFDFDSDHLRPESVVQIQRIARMLIEYPEFGLQISAHTDDVGNDAYNLDLSHRRAYAVLKYMISAGYDTRHISSVGYGETQPIIPNDTPEHRQLNRRVEFRLHVVSPDEQAH